MRHSPSIHPIKFLVFPRCAGGELPLKFLETCGVQIDKKFGEPRTWG